MSKGMSRKTKAVDGKKSIEQGQLGKLPRRYRFILNPYADTRLSKCPICRKLTHMRKFPLLIHIDDWGLLALGKTCRYCSFCELIMAHRDELEDELVGVFERVSPEVIGRPYLVIGTVDMRSWKESLSGKAESLRETLEHAADFKDVLNLRMEGGWQHVKKSTRPAPRRKPGSSNP
jgi:hypothetical protein